MADLQEQMEAILREWNQTTGTKAVRSFREAAELATNILHETSPKKTGDYAKGWEWTERGNLSGTRSRQRDGVFNIGEYVVYNATDWQLTHLLEKGHANPTAGPGKRKRTPPHEHIKPAEQESIKDLIERLYKSL